MGHIVTANLRRAQEALRVLEEQLRVAHVRLEAIDAERKEREHAARVATVDAAISDGRALAAHRDDLVALATSERETDRAMFERLTSQRIGGAPMGRVAKDGESKGGVKASTANLTESERLLYDNYTRGFGWTREKALAKIAGLSTEN